MENSKYDIINDSILNYIIEKGTNESIEVNNDIEHENNIFKKYKKRLFTDKTTEIFTNTFLNNDDNRIAFVDLTYHFINTNIQVSINPLLLMENKEILHQDDEIRLLYKGGNIMNYYFTKIIKNNNNDNNDLNENILKNCKKYFKISDVDYSVIIILNKNNNNKERFTEIKKCVEQIILHSLNNITNIFDNILEKKENKNFNIENLFYYKYIENNYIENKYIENKNKEKTIFTTLVARHDENGQRTKICNEVDIYNTTNNNFNCKIMYPSNFRQNTDNLGPGHQAKINYISQSTYNICPENSEFEGYFTEKIIQAFEAGTIPLYWATALPEKGLINENKYCFCNVDNSNELKEQINKVMTHQKYYLEGNVFTEEAPKILSNYYNTLISNIKIYL